MASSIQLFQFFQNVHEIIGIFRCRTNQKGCAIDLRKRTFLISCGQFMFTTLTYFVFVAKSMFDYGFGIFVLISIANGIGVYVSFLWQRENTLKFIGNCEEFIKQSTHLQNDSTS